MSGGIVLHVWRKGLIDGQQNKALRHARIRRMCEYVYYLLQHPLGLSESTKFTGHQSTTSNNIFSRLG